MINIFLEAYFTHTYIFQVTVNYLVIPIFTSGVKDGVENAHFKKKMLAIAVFPTKRTNFSSIACLL